MGLKCKMLRDGSYKKSSCGNMQLKTFVKFDLNTLYQQQSYVKFYIV